VPAWSENPWGAGVAQLARMVYAEKVWAIVGGIDGPSTHLAEQVVVKARLPLVNPASTDKTVNLINVPWMFSCAPADDLLAALLVAEIRARVGTKSFVLATANDHDSHCLTTELLHGFNGRHMAPSFHFEFQRGTRDVDPLTAHILGAQADALVVVAGADDSAQVVAAVRAGGFSGTIFGGPAMGRRLFIERAGAAAEGALFPLLYDPQAASSAFAASFQARRRAPPDYAEAHAYDAVGLLAAAIGKAGLNRARIGDALRELSPWTGVTGKMTWDASGRNQRDVALGTIRDGRFEPIAGSRVRDGRFEPVAGPRASGESTPR
jgi:branched-chain amino acid transport system substrate-binding protein